MLKSAVTGVTWPLLPEPRVATLLALLYQLERSQYYPPGRLQALRNEQLMNLLVHANATVPFYRQLFRTAGLSPRPGSPLDMQAFRRLPLLTRRDVQQGMEQLRSRQLPPGHGQLMQNQTSGSTGTPVVCYSTELCRLFWEVITERDRRWHQRDDNLRLAAIRYLADVKPGEERRMNGEVRGDHLLLARGPVAAMSIQTDVATQAKWLRARQPDILLSYPSNVAALARSFRKNNWELPSLKEVRTIGESLDDEVRNVCREVWGVPVTDIYSAQETGYLALQCPDYECYHVQAETVFLEVLNSAGEECAPGEVGRVVVTVLHNFAMPLIRYDLGDYAEVGAQCACGRGLPVLRRILGRQRNLLTAPDGRRYWPSFPASSWHGVVPVQQIRIIQQTRHRLKVEFVADRDLSPAEQTQFSEALQAKLPCRFETCLERVATIARSAGGKYEDFVSELGEET